MTAEEIGQVHEYCTQQGGKGTDGEFAVAEDAHPEVEQVVVERGMDVVGGAGGYEVQAAPRQGHAIALVGPQTLRVEAVEAQEGGQDEDEEQGDFDPVFGVTSPEVFQRTPKSHCAGLHLLKEP